MHELETLKERWLAGEEFDAEERARLDDARRNDPALDREMSDLERLHGWVAHESLPSDAASNERVYARVKGLVARPDPRRSEGRRASVWAVPAAAVALAAGVLLVVWVPPGGEPRGPRPSERALPGAYRLEVEGGERPMLGEAGAEPDSALYADSTVELVLRPEQASNRPAVTGTWRQGDRSSPLRGEWQHSASGAARLLGRRDELAPDWTGFVELELRVGEQTIRRTFEFLEAR